MKLSSSTITIPLDYAFEDKSGREIHFVMYEDCDNPNRGFQLDMVAAYSGDDKVGYIKVDYVSSKKWDDYYPSGLLNYMSQIGGLSIFDLLEGWDKPGTDLRKASPEVLNKTAEKLIYYRCGRSMPQRSLETHADFQYWFKQVVVPTRSYENALADFQNFKALIDTPKVAYINTKVSTNNGVMSDNSRLGIGGMLYKVMAKELDKRGMRLHSSTLQYPEAKIAWEKLTKEGIVYKSKKIGGRLAINPKKFDLELKPQTACDLGSVCRPIH